jgi:hypothetical protein
MSEAQILIESAAGKYFSPSILAKATLEYDKNLPNMIQDFNSPINKSKLGQLIELYDPIKGNFLDEYGRKISSTGFNRLLSTNSWFWMMRQGDHHAQVRMMIAALMNKKVKDSSGKEVSLYDAYKLNEETGELKLEVGFENLQIVDEQIKNQLHSINKSMHGVYNSFDRSVMSRYAIGRQIEMYRKFVYTGFMRRWKKNSYDVELGDITEGTYRTFLRVVFKDFNEVAKVLNPLNKESVNLTSLEKENLTRALVEFMFIFLTGLIVMLAEAKDDDEDELLAYTQYFALRLNMELGFFMGIGDPRSFVVLPNPMDAFRMFKTPLITTGVITKFLRLIHQLTGDPTERYTRDAGIAKEGDLKLKIYLWKLLGFNGHTSNPEEALKILQLQLQ